MSTTETNPLLNPTQTVFKPKQQQEIKVPIQMDFGIGIESQSTSLNLNCNQMDWIKVSTKNKYLKSVVWSIDVSIPWFTQEIDVPLILSLAQIGREYQTYFSFDRVKISIQPTHQAFFQGNTKIAFDPAPGQDYYTVVLGHPYDQQSFYQLQTIDFSPKTAQVYEFLCPMLAPFAFLSTKGNGINATTEDYLFNYNMGRLSSNIFSPLTTKGTSTSIQYNVSGELLGLRTEAMKYP